MVIEMDRVFPTKTMPMESRAEKIAPTVLLIKAKGD